MHFWRIAARPQGRIILYCGYSWEYTQQNLIHGAFNGKPFLVSVFSGDISNVTLNQCYRWASIGGFTTVIQCLIRVYSLEEVEVSGPLYYAIEQRHYTTALAILYNLPQEEFHDIRCVLYLAAKSGHTEVFKQILSRTQQYARSAVRVAAGCGHYEIVSEIIEKCPERLDQGALDYALSAAAMSGHASIVQRLLSAGATTLQLTNKDLRRVRYVNGYTDVADIIEQSGRVNLSRRQRKEQRTNKKE